MAKKVDQFEKFRAATLGRPSELSNVIQSSTAESNTPDNVPENPVAEVVESAPAVSIAPAPAEKVSKNADRELVSFHISKDKKKLLGLLKYEEERSFGDLYCEAIDDLLRKYGKLD